MRAAFSPVRWQRAHSVGMRVGKMGDCGFALPSTPCVPWHCLQLGPLGSFFASSWPCVLSWYWAPTSAWHEEQFTFSVIVSQGRMRDGETPVWHWLQAILTCMLPSSESGVTCSERPSLDA